MIGARVCLCACVPLALLARPASAQGTATTRLLILQAEERHATTFADLSLIRISARSGSPDTARVAIRALGRLERVSLITDLLPGLRHSLPEVRVEAANAIAQAAQGFGPATKAPATVSANTLGSTQAALIARLNVETDAGVRGALCEALARLPYRTDEDAARAEAAIVAVVDRGALLADRLGVAKAFEAFVRLQAGVHPASAASLALLRQFARADDPQLGAGLLHDARVRRLALEALITARATDAILIDRAARDPDPQVRRLTMRAIAQSGQGPETIQDGLVDPVAMVRTEALRALRVAGRDAGASAGGDALCKAAMKAAADVDMNTALMAIDQLAACGRSADAVAYLERTVGGLAELADRALARGWHRHAHALVSLAAAAPERAQAAMAPYIGSPTWQVRAYAAQVASQLGDRAALETLSHDADDRVAGPALVGLAAPARPPRASTPVSVDAITSAEIRRLASPRARITIHDVGTLDLALFTSEAPGTVIRFVRLAEAGYYNGLSFDRFVQNALVQGGARTDRSSALPSRETGTWPHVRGSIGASAPDTGDAQFFINLVDNPRFDHQYTVFGQILNGTDVLDRILEGDVIESIVIVP